MEVRRTNTIFGELFSKEFKMAKPRATIETLYSEGPIDPLPGVGPERPNIPFEEEVSRGAPFRTHPEKTPEPSAVKSSGDPYDKDQHLISGAFWAYVVITAIVGIICALFASNSSKDPWLNNLKKSVAFPTETLFFVGSFIALLFIIWVAYRGHIGAPDEMYRYILIITYVINLVLIIVWCAVFFSQRDPKTAFFIALLLILATVWWIWLIWPIDQMAGYLLILYLIWLIYMAWFC